MVRKSRRTDGRNNKRGGCLKWVVIGVLAIGIFGSLGNNSNGEPTSNNEAESVRSAENQDVSQNESKVETSSELPLEKIASDAFENDLTSAGYEFDGRQIRVEANIADNFTTEYRVIGFENKTIKFLESLKNIDNLNVEEIVIVGTGGVIDAYGNKSVDELLIIRMNLDTLQKINFDNFNRNNLSIIADHYYIDEILDN